MELTRWSRDRPAFSVLLNETDGRMVASDEKRKKKKKKRQRVVGDKRMKRKKRRIRWKKSYIRRVKCWRVRLRSWFHAQAYRFFRKFNFGMLTLVLCLDSTLRCVCLCVCKSEIEKEKKTRLLPPYLTITIWWSVECAGRTELAKQQHGCKKRIICITNMTNNVNTHKRTIDNKLCSYLRSFFCKKAKGKKRKIDAFSVDRLKTGDFHSLEMSTCSSMWEPQFE